MEDGRLAAVDSEARVAEVSEVRTGDLLAGALADRMAGGTDRPRADAAAWAA